MKRNKKSLSLGGTLGTGYVSVIMIFVVICLTVLAALSFSAAGINSGQNDRAHEHMAMYYEAENRANRTLMKIDEAAFDAERSGLFMTFADSAAEIGGVTVSKSSEGYTVSWSEKVSEHVTLMCGAVVYEQPELHENRRCDITKWETVSAGEADTHINVWDGTF